MLYDGRPGKGTFFAARDPLGVTTLYQGWAKDGSIWFASEMKALSEDCEKVIHFPAGHQYSSVSGKLVQWFRPSWFPEVSACYPCNEFLKQSVLDHPIKTPRLCSLARDTGGGCGQASDVGWYVFFSFSASYSTSKKSRTVSCCPAAWTRR